MTRKPIRWSTEAIATLEDTHLLLSSVLRRFDSLEGNWFGVADQDEDMGSLLLVTSPPDMPASLMRECAEELNSVVRKYAERSLITLEEDMNQLKRELDAVTTFIKEKRKV